MRAPVNPTAAYFYSRVSADRATKHWHTQFPPIARNSYDRQARPAPSARWGTPCLPSSSTTQRSVLDFEPQVHHPLVFQTSLFAQSSPQTTLSRAQKLEIISRPNDEPLKRIGNGEGPAEVAIKSISTPVNDRRTEITVG